MSNVSDDETGLVFKDFWLNLHTRIAAYSFFITAILTTRSGVESKWEGRDNTIGRKKSS